VNPILEWNSFSWKEIGEGWALAIVKKGRNGDVGCGSSAMITTPPFPFSSGQYFGEQDFSLTFHQVSWRRESRIYQLGNMWGSIYCVLDEADFNQSLIHEFLTLRLILVLQSESSISASYSEHEISNHWIIYPVYPMKSLSPIICWHRISPQRRSP
jgi:hypothetical protein